MVVYLSRRLIRNVFYLGFGVFTVVLLKPDVLWCDRLCRKTVTEFLGIVVPSCQETGGIISQKT